MHHLFGWQKEVMAKEQTELNSEQPTPAGIESTKREVNLFPALLDRKAPSMVASRHNSEARFSTQISMFSPVTFDEAVDIVECLRGRAATTISLEKMRRPDAARLVDFVTGASAALDGDFHKLNDNVYLFCPSNIRISTAEKKTMPIRDYGSSPLDYLFPDRAGKDPSEPMAGTTWGINRNPQ